MIEIGKRVLLVACCAVAAVPFIVGGLWVVGSTIDTISEHRSQREICLKHATNGYDIKRCR